MLKNHFLIPLLVWPAALLICAGTACAQLQIIATNILVFSPPVNGCCGEQIELLAFSPDSRLLGVAHRAGSAPKMEIWTVPELKLTNGGVHLSGDNFRPTAIAFSADNAFVAMSGDYGDTSAARRTSPTANQDLTFDDKDGKYVAISPVTNLLVHAGRRGIVAWQMDYYSSLGRVGRKLTNIQTASSLDWPTALSYAPDGQTVAIAYESGKVDQWQTTIGFLWRLDMRQIASYPNPGARFSAINYLANGTEILTGVSNVVWLRPDLQLPTDVRLHRYQGLHVPHVFTVGRGIHATALTPDGRYLFTVAEGDHLVPSNNDKTNIITMWRVADGRAVFTLDRDTPGTYTLAVAPNGRYLAYGRWDGLVTLAYLPLLIEEFSLAGGRVTLRWYGGSGRYQVQRRKDSDKGKWHNVGKPTTATTFSEKIPGNDKVQFYRVQSLSNP